MEEQRAVCVQDRGARTSARISCFPFDLSLNDLLTTVTGMSRERQYKHFEVTVNWIICDMWFLKVFPRISIKFQDKYEPCDSVRFHSILSKYWSKACFLHTSL